MIIGGRTSLVWMYELLNRYGLIMYPYLFIFSLIYAKIFLMVSLILYKEAYDVDTLQIICADG